MRPAPCFPIRRTICLTWKQELTAQVDHFTVFAATVPADGLAPAVPTGLAKSSASSSKVTLTWNAVTTNSDSSAIADLLGYEIYRDTAADGAFATQVNGADIVGTTFEDSTVAANTTYFYKITAADTGGTES